MFEDSAYKELSEFEVFNKGCGIGTRVIKYYLEQGYKFHLYPNSNDAKKFWESLGFVAKNDGYGATMLVYPDSNNLRYK